MKPDTDEIDYSSPWVVIFPDKQKIHVQAGDELTARRRALRVRPNSLPLESSGFIESFSGKVGKAMLDELETV